MSIPLRCFLFVGRVDIQMVKGRWVPLVAIWHPIAGGGSAKVFGESFDVRRRRSSMLGLGVSVSRLLSLALRATGDSGVNQSGEART